MKVAVVGCGYWGKNLVRNCHALGVLGGVVDLSSAARAAAQAIAPVPAHETIDPILDDRSIDGVVIATPAETHVAITRRALLAGKDVLCEKPLALRYDDARDVVKLARDRNRVLMVGHTLEYHPAIHTLQQLIAGGQLGAIRYIYSNRLNLGRVRREENILWSFAPHDIAVILRLVRALPFQVSATGGAWLQPNVADVTVTQMRFDNGVSAHVFVSWLNPFKEQRLVIVGSHGMATFDDVRRELVLHDQAGAGTPIQYAADEPLRLECQAFVDAIASRRPPLTDGDSALRVLRVLEAAQRSLGMQGQPVSLEPA